MNTKLLLLSLILFTALTGAAQKVTQSFNFESPQFIDRYDGFVEPQIKGCFNTGQEGEPLLPLYSAEILLPQGSQIKSINILSVEYGEDISDIKIIPAQRQFPISQPAPADYRPTPIAGIYNFDAAFPASIIRNNSSQYLGGYSIAVVGINLMEYNPVQKTVRYIREITLEIETENLHHTLIRSCNNNPLTQKRLSIIVENPEMAQQYSFAPQRSETVDMLVITKAGYADLFETYIQFKTERGFAIALETVEDIYTTYPGDDNQEKIRNCIIDYYENKGLTYVVLGGDADPATASSNIVPHRGFYVNTGFGTVDDDIPSDMYYCCLDGTWDNNNNGNYGESGEEDLYAEVIVGRMCVDSPSDITNMISKLIKYQDAPVVQDIGKALMVGEALDDDTWGGDSKDEVANGSSSFGYTTVGLSDNFSVDKLYEKLGNWSKYDVFAEFNNVGCHFLNHLGHSNTTYNMKMYNSDLTVSNFQNDGISRGLVIGYSQGCYNGAFDNRGSEGNYGSDCFSENITTLPTAEVATLGNSRYGWYSSGNTNGASQYLDRQFFDAIFDEDMTQIGVANGDSREDNAAYILSDQVIRWCAYEITLFGDPTMDIWTQQPVNITASHPAAIAIGISELAIVTDAPFARAGLMQNDVLIGRGIADASGNMDVEFFDPVSSTDIIELKITAHNKNLYSETIAVVSDQPYVIVDAFEINDASTGNNNGMADYGETIQLGLSLKNVGNQPANNVMVTLSSTDQFISIPYLAVDFGNFDPGETITIQDAFDLIVAENVPDLHEIEIVVSAAGQDEWNSDLAFTTWAPNLLINELNIDDNAGGNGNGMLDPGETVVLEINVMNQGHALSPELLMELEALNENISIVSSAQNHPALAINATGLLTFEAEVSSDAATGDIAEMQALLTGEAYEIEKYFALDIGVLTETFESGDFSQHAWQFSGNNDWEICTADPWEGSYCIRSGAIGHNASSEISLQVMIATADAISFYRKVSSESGYDYLTFYVDNTMKGQWAGEEAWQEVSFNVPAGMHTLRWVYEKDPAVANGTDCGWIDYIKFPPLSQASITAGDDAAICQGENFQPDASGMFVQGIQWETSGDGNFNNTNMLKPTYTPGSQDIADGAVILSVEAAGMSGGMVSDAMTLYINASPAIPEMPEGEILVCTNYGLTYDYTCTGGGTNDAYVWELIPEEAGTLNCSDNLAAITWTPEYIGSVQLHVKAINACGESSFSEALDIEAEICTGIQDLSKPGFSIVPNPNTGNFKLQMPGETIITKITIYNAFGQIVMIKNYQEINSEIDIELNAPGSGMYYLEMESEHGRMLRKFVIR